MLSSKSSLLSRHAERYAEALRNVAGWRRAGLAFLFGSLGALAFPPVTLFPVLWLVFPSLVFLMQGVARQRTAFVTGWCFAFGYYLFSLYWIAAAMFVDIAKFWWAVPLAVAGLPAFFALFYGVAMIAAYHIGMRKISGCLVVALCWFAADYARGHVLTGFPWNLEGSVWDGTLPILQIASVIGIYGLTLVTLVAATIPAMLAEHNKTAWRFLIGSFAMIIGVAAWGHYRLDHADNSLSTPTAHIRIVQPNVAQADKWVEGEAEKNFQHLLNLTAVSSRQPIAAVIWPETASTFYLAEDATHRYQIAQSLPNDSVLITGVIRRDGDDNDHVRYYNSLVAVDTTAHILSSYDKFHLVPFGEYMPLRRYIPLATLANLGIDFTPGDGLHSLTLPHMPSFSPLICYEAIFPGAVVPHDARPDFLLNVTNDGWYGKTSGPYQHFAAVRMRAIEEGLPLVRSANTGISGVIDGYGRIQAHLGLGLTGIIDANIPSALPPTLFARLGTISVLLLFCLFLATAVIL